LNMSESEIPMSQSKNILVPIDFSDCAVDVVRKASRAAEQSGARVVLMHVVHVPEGLDESTPVRPDGEKAPIAAIDHLLREAERRMPEYVAVAKERDVDVSVRITHGEVVATIVAASEESGVERIMMGTHARKGLTKFLLGSVADQVRKRSSRPVEAIPTVHKSHCKAGSCGWCATHESAAMVQLRLEQDG
jgi:nucleotide-binding universal stress UspA family protein